MNAEDFFTSLDSRGFGFTGNAIYGLPIFFTHERKRPLDKVFFPAAKEILNFLGIGECSLENLTFEDYGFLLRAVRKKYLCGGCDGRGYEYCGCLDIGVEVIDGKLKISTSTCASNLSRTEQERHREEKEKVERLLLEGHIPQIFQHTFSDSFKITALNKQAASLAKKCILDNSGLYLFGECGTGKTMLSCIIANERARIGKASLFVTVPDMLEELRDFDHNEKRTRKLSLLCNVGCLIVDDLGAERPSKFASETLFRIFNHRYNSNLQTIITSNFPVDMLSRRWEDPYSGNRVTRRIKAICGMCKMGYM